jgi:hypothetical protein
MYIQIITDHDLGPKNIHMYLPYSFDLSDNINRFDQSSEDKYNRIMLQLNVLSSKMV